LLDQSGEVVVARKFAAVSAIVVLVVAGCGSSDDPSEETDTSESATPPARGTLVEAPPPRTASIAASDLLALLNAGSTGTRLLELILAPECGVDVHEIEYHTVDPVGAPIVSSGALMIPTGAEAVCQGPRPLLVYAHGTQAERDFNIANLSDEDNIEGLSVAAVFAAHGYVVIAPNYAGYHTSTLPYHPYLHADQQAGEVLDALEAARSALPTSFAPTVADSGELVVTGYSQGGYVAMAAHRLLQQSGVAVTASAPMSGPYALSAFGDAVFYGQVVRSAPLVATLVAIGYQRAYGDIYAEPTDLFEARYASGIESLLPTDGPRSALFSEGRLPADQLFSATPPDPAYAPYTPATTPEVLAPVFALGFGPEHLITNAYRLAYLNDAQAHPDGGFPQATDGLPPAAPSHPLRQAFKANDLRTWLPTSPVLLCGGNEDPSVLFLNTGLMRDYWAAQGVTAPVEVLDLDDEASLGDPHAALKVGFAAAKEALAADGGAMAVAEAYHSALVPPFCLAAVQSFFDSQ
jgi:hypothetical protein